MVFTKLLLETDLAIRPCNREAASEPLLPKVAHCRSVLPSRYAVHVLRHSDTRYAKESAPKRNDELLSLLHSPRDETETRRLAGSERETTRAAFVVPC